jgi:HAD superfamily hydrolase (TIGR01549 family)
VSRLRAVVFDFDGIILESIDVKTRAFVALFERWPEHADAIRRLHLDNAGMSRYEKFKRIHRDILELPLDYSESERLGQEFVRLIRAEMLSCEFVAGAPELLERLAAAYPLYVASATPETEIREIVRERGLSRFFAEVYGSPASKAEILRRILTENDCAPDEVVFVGDALSDYHAAREVGAPFVARVPPNGDVVFPGDGVTQTVPDLRELDNRWNELESAVGAWTA